MMPMQLFVLQKLKLRTIFELLEEKQCSIPVRESKDTDTMGSPECEEGPTPV